MWGAAMMDALVAVLKQAVPGVLGAALFCTGGFTLWGAWVGRIHFESQWQYRAFLAAVVIVIGLGIMLFNLAWQ
jgi:hypothetical protein